MESEHGFHPMNPIFAIVVSDAAVQSVRRQHEDEMASVADTAQKIVVELAGAKLLYVEEDGQTTQLQVDFQQTAHTGSVTIRAYNLKSHRRCNNKSRTSARNTRSSSVPLLCVPFRRSDGHHLPDDRSALPHL